MTKNLIHTTLFLIATALSFATACAGIQVRIKKFEQCAADKAIADASGALGGAVSGVLTSGATNWKQQLDALAKEFGGDAIACAAQAFLSGSKAKADLSTPRDGGALMALPPAVAEKSEAANQRARSYIAGLGLVAE